MRILFLVHRIPYPPNKGDKIRSFAELRAISEFAEVDLFCFYDDHADQANAQTLRKYCTEYYAEWLSPVPARFRAAAALLGGRPFSLAYFHSSSMQHQIGRALARGRYDCVLVFCSSMAQYVMNSAVPWVLDMVDVDSDKWQQYADHHTGLKRWIWHREACRLADYERQIVACSAQVVLSTDKEARILRTLTGGAHNISSLENSIDLRYYDPSVVDVPTNIRELAPYVIFPGQMDYFPNVEGALRFHRESLPILRSRVPLVHFIIAGRNPAPALRRLQSDPAVAVTGTVDDIRPWLKGAAVAVIPLQIARGIQNKILECLAMGIPVVCGSKCAAALPSAVADLLLIEDHPVATAERLADVISSGQRPSLERVYRVLDEHYGFERLRDSLHTLLVQAGCGARKVGSLVAKDGA